MQVPVHQGIFVHNIDSGQTILIAKTGKDFNDFLFWNYSGRVPGTGGGSGEGDEGDAENRYDGALRPSSLFRGPATRPLTLSLKQPRKIERGGEITGIYRGWQGTTKTLPVLDTTMSGQVLDSNADQRWLITELGMERDSFRNGWLVICCAHRP